VKGWFAWVDPEHGKDKSLLALFVGLLQVIHVDVRHGIYPLEQ
jgi:hypothetical protein